MVKEMKIVLHPYPTEGFYLVGSSVVGEVYIKTGSKKTNYSRINVTLVGTISSNFNDHDNNIRCAHSDELLKETVTIWDKTEEGGKFPKGVSQLPFALTIPSSESTYPSFDSQHCTVTYTVQADILKDRNKEGGSTSTTIKVYPPVNVSNGDLQSPRNARVDMAVPSALCCLSGGSIEAEIRMPHQIYEVNEIIEFEVEVINNTRKRLPYFDGGLMQKVTYGGTPTSRFRNSSAILYGQETKLIGDRAKSNPMTPRSTWGEKLILRAPPTLPPTYTSIDSMLTIEYFILARVHRTNKVRDSLTIECPVVIGNVHLQDAGLESPVEYNPGQVSDLTDYGDNPPNYLDVFNSPGSVGMDTNTSPAPSAPSLPRDAVPPY